MWFGKTIPPPLQIGERELARPGPSGALLDAKAFFRRRYFADPWWNKSAVEAICIRTAS